MKSKFVLLAIATIITISTAGTAQAQNLTAGVQVNADIKAGTQASTSATVRGNATSSAAKNNNASTSRGNATSTAVQNEHASTTANTNGENLSAGYRSVVGTFVQSLLAVADHEGGIGAQVRIVAQAQNDSASTTTTAITKVDERGSFHTFLTGSDYKNLGVIRSGIASTSANIDKLKEFISKATSDADRAELNVQIKALEDEQVKLDAYIKANEGKFSLFGWFNRLFIK